MGTAKKVALGIALAALTLSCADVRSEAGLLRNFHRREYAFDLLLQRMLPYDKGIEYVTRTSFEPEGALSDERFESYKSILTEIGAKSLEASTLSHGGTVYHLETTSWQTDSLSCSRGYAIRSREAPLTPRTESLDDPVDEGGPFVKYRHVKGHVNLYSKCE